MNLDSIFVASDGKGCNKRRVLLANPRGFCAGVDRAIEAVERALEQYGAPVYVRRAIVHNRSVVERLERKGAIFVQELDAVPEGSIALLSAHGSARAVKTHAQHRGLHIVDTVCPLVSKVHAEVEAWYRAGRHVLLIGHQGHPEIVGTLGQLPTGAISVVSRPEDLRLLDLGSNAMVAYAVQTTYSVREAEEIIAAIRSQFKDVAGPKLSDICYATTNRQAAIEQIARTSQLVLVVGDSMSSNSRRLVEIAHAAGCPSAQLISDESEIPWLLVEDVHTIGLTAAASTPAAVIQRVCDALEGRGFALQEVDGPIEQVRFRPVLLQPLEQRSAASNIEDRLIRLRKDIDDVLDQAIGRPRGRDRRLVEAMRYAVIGSGKRFRALLVAVVADLVSGSYRSSLRVGAAIECIHAQSLVHDDLPCMDDDDMRRGRPTLHRKFDEATAVLAGDALLALAFELLADDETHADGAVRARLVLALAKAIGQNGLAGGQMMDLYPPLKPTKADLFACESRKTGALIRYAVEAGAMLGNCSPTELERLLRFAENLGLVFQIRDDMLDSIGSVAMVGKALGKDMAAGRASATTILGVEGAAQQATELENACRGALDFFGAKANPLLDLTRFAASRMH
jgi:(E)-4-hydroxy-3-methyl-but-2-enyl pyrophosphate reductase